ncbi:NACHT domain-containing protein [Pseudomonas chlororaphis]|uniref:NACHT domain-containing protein n=1 Tax=Pseudomonas chlororaphis TaxID=587753 RepID=UPI0035D4C2AF
MPEAATLAAAASASRLIAPIVNSIYNSAKESVKNKLKAWKAGENLEKISDYYIRLAHVKTIFSRDEAIPIDSFYYPSRVSFKSSCKPVNSLKDLPDGCIVVEGVVGQGKSIFMRHLATSILSENTQKKIPIFIELRNISNKKSLKTLIWQKLKDVGVEIDEEVFNYLIKEQKIVLLLDGFDELSEESMSETLLEINDLKNINSKFKIIVSSRPQNAIQNVTDFKVVKLQPLRFSDHEAFLSKLGVDSARIVELVAAIKDSPKDIQNAISTPLMMSIVVLVYESAKQIPPYLSEFFSALFHVVFTQHDSLKDAFRRKHHTELSENQLQHLFEAFCFVVMQKSYGRTLSVSKFHECFEKAQKYVPDAKCTADSFRADIVGVACLMLEEGIGEVTFLHKGILDYFAAAFAARLDRLSENFYTSAASSYKNWMVTLQFLGQIDRHRYLKYYYLVYVLDEQEALTTILQEGDDTEIKDYVIDLFGQAEIRYDETVAEFRLQTNHRSELAEYAAGACRDVIVRFPVHTTKIAGFRDYAANNQMHLDLSDNEVTFGLGVAFDLYGLDSIREALRDVESEFFRQIKCAKEQLEEYERRDAEIDMSFDL